MVRLASPFVLGVALATGAQPALAPVLLILLAASIMLVAMLLLPVDQATRWRRGAAVAAWSMAFGASWQTVHAPRSDAAHAMNARLGEGHWLVEVSGINRRDDRSISAEGRLRAVLRGDSVREVHGLVLLALKRAPAMVPIRKGDELLVSGVLAPIARTPDPGGFDRTAWAASRGIAHEIGAGQRHWHRVGHRPHWSEAFSEFRTGIGDWLESSELNAREGALVKALVLGERDELDSGRRDAFVRSGTIHVLAVSGMHVGLIYLVITRLLGWMGKTRWARIGKGVLVLACLWFYAGLTGASPSVMRASVMFSLFTIAGMARERTDHLNSLFAAAWLLLVWDPLMITQASFQLSFLAVMGIILFQRPLEGIWAPESGLVRKAWSLAVMSVSAQALTAPVSLLLFKGFPLWFLPANLVVVTAAGFAVYGGVALIALYAVPYAGAAIALALRWLIAAIDATTVFFAQLPWSYPAIRIGADDAAMLYAVILGLGAWWRWHWSAAKLVAFAGCAVLLVNWAMRASDAHGREQLVVYDQPTGFVAGILVGRDLVVISSADSLLADPRVAAKLDRHRRHDGIARILPAGTDAIKAGLSEHDAVLMGGGRIRTARLDALLIDGSSLLPATGRFDAVILHGPHAFDDAGLDRIAMLARRLVLTADVPWPVRRSVLAWAEVRNVMVHDVRGQGAFLASPVGDD